MDQQELQEVRSKAEKARQLLEDLVDPFQEVEKALIRASKSVKTEHEALKACVALQVFDLIKGQLTARIEDEKIVEFNFRDKKFGIF